MAGIQPLPSLSESQMAAMAGGPALRIEAIASTTRGARLDPGDAILKGPQRLGKGLLDSSLALPLLIQVAQQRQACVYRAPNAHLKSLAGLYDATHGVLFQYLELLTSPSVVTASDYATRVLPSLAELGRDYGICAPICMQIIRPVLNASLLTTALAMQEQERLAGEEAEKRLKAALTAKREPGITASRLASPSGGNPSTLESSDPKPGSIEESETPMEIDVTNTTPTQKDDGYWVPELFALFEDVKAFAPRNAYDVIGPGFYLTFWQLSTYDLTPPSQKYDEEGARLRALSRQEDSKYFAADRSADRSKRLTASSHRTHRDRYNAFVNILAQEFKEQTISRAFTIKRLAREKNHWFSHSTKPNALINAVIEHCIQPRCLLSPMDADFCAQFIKVLHLQGTPGFHTLGCYDKLLGDHVKVVLFSCSEYEARNYGRFLLGTLRDILAWHLDEAAYIQDTRTKVAGKTVLLPGLQKKFSNKVVVATNVLKWSEFQQVVRKWHRKLTKCFIDCILTGEFMHVYNAIVVMKEILDVFPLVSVNDCGAAVNSAINRLVESEERGDLKILARSYSASLKKREADWAPTKLPTHLNGTASPRPSHSTSSPAPEKIRTTPLPTGPTAQSTTANDSRRTAPQPPSSTPSAPRAQIATNNTAVEKSGNISSTKLAMESIPRPEVVKRVRPETKAADSPKGSGESPIPSKSDSVPLNDRKAALVILPSGSRDEISGSHFQQNGPPGKDHGDSSRLYNPQDQTHSRGDTSPVMPPPVVPSQTASAQELRETARQSMGRTERSETRSQNGSATHSPRVRSPSPSSRPGTRNPSNESRTSGGKSRSDPGNADRSSDDRRAEREGRTENRETAGVSRRDSLTHTRTERSGRDREKDRDGDRDKDRGRDRHGERDREKDRDRDRDRERDRERERERDRDRDRHRRDDKDRDRETRKEREALTIRGQPPPVVPVIPADDRGLPIRPDIPRHRNPPQNGDDNLGKRRRPADDDPDRGSKRSSRRESHREDRSRRPGDREDKNRESDRRRKDREGPDPEVRGSSSSEKHGEKKTPETPKVPASTPSGPRAMGSATGDSSRAKVEPISGRDRHRDTLLPPQPGASTSQMEHRPSLRSRISVDPPLSFRPTGSREDDDREIHRKRTASDRDLDNDTNPGQGNELGMQPPKRPRPNRRNYPNNQHALARKLLPIDPSAGDKSQRRQD